MEQTKYVEISDASLCVIVGREIEVKGYHVTDLMKSKNGRWVIVLSKNAEEPINSHR